MLAVAFKEWAAICRALADGRQALIIRKGGIAEEGGVFRPEHPRFWLYPTFAHQQETGLAPGAEPLLRAALAGKPPAGVVRLTHFAEVGAIRFVDRLDDALALAPRHVWSEDTVRQRFHYRTPGLYVLAVRVYAATPADLPERPEYAGCKTWVDLGPGVADQPATPVLSDAAYAEAVAAVTAPRTP